MKALRDHQRHRVYSWEDRVVAPRDPTTLGFHQAQSMVDALWNDLGLCYPPQVEPLPPQVRRRLADASRLRLRLPPELPAWVLLHELAHVLSSTADGGSDGHGPVFMGLYVQLLVRYLRLEEAELTESLNEAGIEHDPSARPVFLDEVEGRVLSP